MTVFVTLCLLLLALPWSAHAQQRGKPAVLTRAQIKEAEQRLAELGYWTGAVDGVFDSGSRAALIAFQKWEGRPVTTKLTLAELEAISASQSPKARDAGYGHVEVDLDRQVLLIIDDAGRVKVLPVSSGSGKPFVVDGQTSIAYTPRGRFVVYDKTFGWEDGVLGSVYYANYITGGVAIHGYESVPTQPESRLHPHPHVRGPQREQAINFRHDRSRLRQSLLRLSEGVGRKSETERSRHAQRRRQGLHEPVASPSVEPALTFCRKFSPVPWKR
jgi:peptidoglycan hydrolase-like protein with peptidoglycan-binding domain